MNTGQILNEIQFKAVRSGGAGGQHVNKVSTKVILMFDLMGSRAFSNEEKERLLQRLGSRLTKNKLLIVQAADTRSQIKNREIAQQRLLELLERKLEVVAKRKKSKPPKKSKEKRLKLKQRQAEKKIRRKKPGLD
ncbi:MAG: alternative ribosome rescue aminoacyl-tRNA hydrolase ArfB [Flavobacteriaceae bacterium]